MKTDKELVEFCESKLGTPYVFGMKGDVLTEGRLNSLKKECPHVHTDTYQQLARKYLGKVCTDCSGLISWCTGITRGSAEYQSTAVEKRPVSALNDSMIGWALWKPGHIGIYIGGGDCIEAKGIKFGTVKTRLSDNHTWKLILKLKDIHYKEVPRPPLPEAKWELDETGWKYHNKDGSYVTDAWYEDAALHKWYWFDGSGHAVRQKWYQFQGKWYYFGEDCCMVKGYHKIENRSYYFDDSGALIKEGFWAVLMEKQKPKWK